MRSRIVKSIFTVVIGLMFNTLAWAESPPLVASTCAGCHGIGGSSVGPATPTIAGLDKKTFVDIMVEYKTGERHSTIMGRIAKGYTSADFEVMANYFNEQYFVRYPQQVDANKVKKGEKLHQEYCQKCHEYDGYVDNKGTSILAGQWLLYLQYSMIDFHLGDRRMPRRMIRGIRKMVKRAGEESLDNIVHFYGSKK